VHFVTIHTEPRRYHTIPHLLELPFYP